MRDGEQSPGISLNAQQKLEIAQQLTRLGVDVIEAGFPVTSPGDFDAVWEISRNVDGPVICALARTVASDIDRAWEAVRDAARPRIHMVLATSDLHIEHKLQTTPEDVLGQARAAVAHAKQYVDDVEFSCEDGFRSDREFMAEVISATIAEGATTINVADTVGLLVDESVTQGGGDRSTSVAHAEPGVDVVEVRFDGGGADADLLGDLSRREAVGSQAEHLGLP